jgi:hypothetical protein
MRGREKDVSPVFAKQSIQTKELCPPAVTHASIAAHLETKNVSPKKN